MVWTGLILINIANYITAKEPDYTKSNSYKPKVLVMVPCKGNELHLKENLRSLISQTYKNYSAVAIVDNIHDEAIPTIKRVGVEYIISRKICTKCSGKVRALATALQKYRRYDLYVIADSDVSFSRDWLKELIIPLSDKRVGLSTAFPFFNPSGGFWSRVKMVWGFVGDGMMESSITRFGWGGSLAFRNDLLDKKSFEIFEESVSDDIPITRIAKSKGLRIVCSSKRLIEIYSSDNFKTFFEWANRQTALTILGYRKNFRYGVVFYSANILLLISAFVLAIVVNPIALILLIPFLIGLVKAFTRTEKRYVSIIPIYFIINFVYLANLLKARSMEEIRWRGRVYRLRYLES